MQQGRMRASLHVNPSALLAFNLQAPAGGSA